MFLRGVYGDFLADGFLDFPSFLLVLLCRVHSDFFDPDLVFFVSFG